MPPESTACCVVASIVAVFSASRLTLPVPWAVNEPPLTVASADACTLFVAIVPDSATVRPEPSTLLPPLACAELSAVATMEAFSIALIEMSPDVAVTAELVIVAEAPPTTSLTTNIAVAATALVVAMLKSVSCVDVAGTSFQRERSV